jgi:2-hydroxychromene-2-carboxylate isomerase
VLRDALAASGLGADAVMSRMQNPAVRASLTGNIEMSVSRGALGSPTFFVGDAMYFGKNRLRDVEEPILGVG